MKNVISISDISRKISTEGIASSIPIDIKGISVSKENDEILLLTNTGFLLSYKESVEQNDACLYNNPISLNTTTENINDCSWFSVQAICETNSVICISNSGFICCIKRNDNGSLNNVPLLEGQVDGGIVTAKWNNDESCVIIITNNNTLLCMTNTLEILNEIPIIARVPHSPCLISFRGDGQVFALYAADMNDQINYVHIYDKECIWQATCKAVSESGSGPNSIVKGLLPQLAYSYNGSLIATVQQKSTKKIQV